MSFRSTYQHRRSLGALMILYRHAIGPLRAVSIIFFDFDAVPDGGDSPLLKR